MNKTGLMTLLAILLIFPIFAGAADGVDRIVIPDGLFYYRPVATVAGSEASWVNPAGLGRFGAAGFQIMADYYQGDYARSYGAIVYRERMTTGFRHIHNPDGTDYDEMLMATGMKLGPSLSTGFSYRYFRDGPGEYDHRHFWNIGLMSRGVGPFALGALFSNLNRGKVNGERTAVEQHYSAGIRPLRNKLTLAADMLLSSHQKLSEADFIYHAEYTPKPGLYITGYVDSDRNFQIGVRANLLKYFVGSQSTFNRKGHDGHSTFYVGATNQRQPSLIPDPRRSLRLSLSGGMAENPPQPIFGPKGTPFLTMVLQLYRAADDPSISTIQLQLDRLALGFGQAQELRDALAYFKSRGKRIICHVSTPNNIGYYVASIADTILIPPVCQVRLVGLRAELTFWAGTLDKLGVDIDLLRVGEFKTAPESYTQEAASDENRQQMNRILDDLYDQFVTAIATGRDLTVRQVRELVDQGPFTSAEALELGLVDGLSYRDKVGSDYLPGLPVISFRNYRADSVMTDDWQEKPTIAVVVAEGEISASQNDSNPLQPSRGVTPAGMQSAYQKALATRGVAGVVLRINSPGGWATAGEDIYHSGANVAEHRPLAISMSNVAASGGYHIAMAGSTIFANSATVTGSIGIYGGKLDLSGLYEKIGVGKELYTRGRYAGMLTNIRPFTDDERAKYQSHLQAFYDYFVELVATNRGLTTDSVNQLGRGLVWTGREAVNNGLADRTGGIKQALDYVAADAGLEEYTVEIFPKKRPWLVLPGGSLWSHLVSFVTGTDHDADTHAPELPVTEDGSIMARMPFDLIVE